MTTRPYAYNTGSTISGATQFGNLAIGITEQDYSSNPGGVKWWMGPDETPGTYMIAVDDPGINQSTPTDDTAGVSFWRTSTYTDASFISAANTIARRKGQSTFTTSTDALNWLISSGFPTTYPYEEICDIDTLVYLSGLTTTLSTTQTYLVNKFIVDLKHRLGIRRLSDAFDVMYILAGETEESSLRNLVSRNHDATAVNSPTFTQFEGYNYNGTSQHINTNYIPVSGNTYQLTGSFGLYYRKLIEYGSTYEINGAYRYGDNNCRTIIMRPCDAQERYMSAVNSTGASTYTNERLIGMYYVNRSETNQQLVVNNVYRNTLGTLSNNIVDQNLLLGACMFSSGTVAFRNKDQHSFCIIGSGLTLTQIAIITETIEEYLDARDKGSIYEPETYTYISGLTTSLSQEQVGYIDTFVRDLKTGMNISSLSDAFDVMYILAGETEESSLRNLVSRNYDATAINSPVFTQYEGYSGNNISSYITTNWTGSTNGNAYTLNSASFGIYFYTTIDYSTQYQQHGVYARTSEGGINYRIEIYRPDGKNTKYSLSINSIKSTSVTSDDRISGMYIGSRLPPSSQKLYVNNVVKINSSASATLIPSQDVLLLAERLNGGTVAFYDNDRISFAVLGRGLSVNDVSVLTNSFEKYLSFHEKNILWEDETYTYISGLTTPISYEQINLIDTFIKDIKTGLSITGLTDAFDVMYILAGETEESSLRNLVKRQNDATKLNATLFSQYRGYRGNGTSTSIRTNYIPSTHGVNNQQDSCSAGIYMRQLPTIGGYVIGGGVGVGVPRYRLEYSSTRYTINDGTLTATSLGLGLNVINRRTSTVKGSYMNKSETSSSLTTIGNCPYEIFFMSYTSSQFTNPEISFGFSGRGFSEAEMIIIDDAFEKYMDARGYGVIT